MGRGLYRIAQVEVVRFEGLRNYMLKKVSYMRL